MNTLSDGIQSFNYGFLRKNKPNRSKIDDNSKHLGLNFNRSMCILRSVDMGVDTLL